MKFLKLSVFLFLFSTQFTAQTYYDWPAPGWKQTMLSSSWNGVFSNTGITELHFSHDTLIDGVIYKNVKLGFQEFQVRQESGEFFWREYDHINEIWTDQILYDFSLEVGDPVEGFDYVGGTYNYSVATKQKILSTDNDSIYVMELVNDSPFPDTITWIEGVGDLVAGIRHFVGPDGGLQHICTLNANNQTISEYSNQFSVCECDYIHGEDQDNDGYRNHIHEYQEIQVQLMEGLPVIPRNAKSRTCDTLVIKNFEGGQLTFFDAYSNGNSITPDEVINQVYYFYHVPNIDKLWVELSQAGYVYVVDILDCETNDCDDQNPAVNFGESETPYNGIDDDCNPMTLDDDLDGDGFELVEDCDDTNAEINPDATEVPYNGVDEDCNVATLDDDLDEDGFVLAEDCDDTNAEINPDATEVPYNGVDEDCNAATLDDDLDEDGFVLAEDCDDTNAGINPDALDIPNNGIDEDCDGSDLVNSIKDIVEDDILLYPNPADTKIKVTYPGQGEVTFKIISSDGVEWMNGKLGEGKIDVSNLEKGLYVLIVNGQEGEAMARFMKL